MPRDSRRSGYRARGGLVAVVLVASAACSAERDGPLVGLPGASTAPGTGLVPSTLGAGARPWIEALSTNFVEGGRLAARLDPDDATCVAPRWIGLLGPARLEAGGLAAAAMTDVTLERLRGAVEIDRRLATALVESFDACGADYELAFLESLIVVGQLTLEQRVCLSEVLPPGLLESITIGVLADEPLDEARTQQYAAALDECAN